MRVPFITAAIVALAGNLPAATAPGNLAPKPPATAIQLFAVKGEPALDLVLPFFTDPENDLLSYRLEGLPPGLSFDAPNRTIRGTTDKTGPFTLTLFADDGHGNSASTMAKLQVNVLPPRQFYRTGGHPRNFVRVYAPNIAVTEPTPAVVFIHGGGWTGGYPETWPIREQLRNAGITCITVTYRMLGHAHEDGVTPPVQGTMDDIRRALQFIRYKAVDPDPQSRWNIDPKRIAVTGASAGACAALQLALGDDRADPNSPDPIARQSTRPLLAAVNDPQTTLDPDQVDAWIPSLELNAQRQDVYYGGHAFGITRLLTANPPIAEAERMFAGNFLHNRATFLEFKSWAAAPANRALVEAYSPWYLATADDPAIFMIFNNAPGKTNQPFRAHAPEYGPPLHAKLTALGVPCELVLPPQTYAPELLAIASTGPKVENTSGRTDAHVSDLDYLTAKLLGNHAPSAAVLADRSLTVGAPWSWTLPAFTDVDGDPLHYDVTGLPPGLAFNPLTRSLSGTPLATGTHALTVTAHDYRGGSVSTSLTLTVTGSIVPPPPAPGSGLRDVIYAEGIKTGWTQQNLNCSGWLLSTVKPHAGLHSYAITINAANGYAGMWSQSAPYNVGKQTTLTFWIHGGVGGQNLEVQAVRVGGTAPGRRLAPLAAGTWQQVAIPVAELGIAGASDLSAIRFINRGSAAAPTFYIDDVAFDEAAPSTVTNNG